MSGLGPTDIVIERRTDGTILLRSPHALGPYPGKMTEPLDYWASHASYRTFLAERDAKGRWRNVTYAEAQYFARRIGQALINRDLSVQNPVILLSSSDIEHALLGLGAMYAGVPYALVSSDYSPASTDNIDKLRYIFELLTPGLVFVSNGKKFEHALRAVLPEDAELVVNEDPLPGATMFADLVNTEPNASLDHAHSHVTAETVFKISFTWESSDIPKGVIHTHRTESSNQEMARAYFQFLNDEPPVIVGGHADMGLVLYNGGSLYIDHGEPETIRNLRVIAPTMYGNVPKGFEALIPYLRNDAAFRKHFFSRLKLFYCVGAGLSQQVWGDLAKISAQEIGEPILQMTALGSIETTPHALFGLPGSNRTSLFGVPAQGVELKLVPSGEGKFEVRLRGPNVTPGYWRRLDQTRAAFDEEGFYKLGENLRFADDADPAKGLVLV